MRERGSLWSTRPVSCRDSMRRFLLSSEGWPYLLVPFIPIAVILEFGHVGAVPTFFASTLGVIPTAALMGRATEELAARHLLPPPGGGGVGGGPRPRPPVLRPLGGRGADDDAHARGRRARHAGD